MSLRYYTSETRDTCLLVNFCTEQLICHGGMSLFIPSRRCGTAGVRQLSHEVQHTQNWSTPLYQQIPESILQQIQP